MEATCGANTFRAKAWEFHANARRRPGPSARAGRGAGAAPASPPRANASKTFLGPGGLRRPVSPPDIVLTADARTHSAYAELIASPPEGVRYDVKPLHWGSRLSGSWLRDQARWKLHAARRAWAGDPVGFPAPAWGRPVHAANALLRTTDPWVLDFEHPWAFTAFDGDRLRARRARLAAALADARVLLPWTNAAARAMAALLPEAQGRMRVCPPGIQPRPAAVRDEDAPLVHFVAGLFERKGGPEAVEAFARVRRDFPRARMRMVTNAPPGLRAEGVEVVPANLPRERALESFAQASVYLMPTQFDTYGMVFLEAMAHGVPVVALEGFGTDEIVRDGRDGWLVRGYDAKWFGPDMLPVPGGASWEQVRLRRTVEERERVVADLAERLRALLADPAKARAMGEAGRARVTDGDLSADARNRRLLAAYREAFG